MSDTSGKTSGLNENARAPCRVAYTLNNMQPVSCTIISDQPLFYMDFDGSMEDELPFDAAEIGLLEKEISTLQKQIDSYSKNSYETSQSTESRVMQFLDDASYIVKDYKPGDFTGLMQELKNTLEQSRLASTYLSFATEHKVELALCQQVEKSFYDRVAGKIFLNPNLHFADLALLAVSELRRHWQHRQGVLINPLMFHPDNAVLINRAQIADLSVSMIRAAWEMQLSGRKDIWERIEHSPMSDLARAFAREAFMDFRTINNGQACAAVFETWFLSERCCHQDKTLIQQMLADHQGYVFDVDQALQAVTPNLIAGLGNMPFGKNYLAQHAATIMDDPVFTDVRDRSNANFLWFIKFERSFKETEQELQTSEGLPAAGALPEAKQPSQDRSHDRAQTAEIISLYSRPRPTKGKRDQALKCATTGQASGAQIVYLRGRPADS